MPNTRSASKALRQSKSKRSQNLFWKTKIRDSIKEIKKHLGSSSLDIGIIKKEEVMLYKVVDKAAKNNVIHKNKAKRIKSKVSKQIAAHEKPAKTIKKEKKSNKGGSKTRRKSKT